MHRDLATLHSFLDGTSENFESNYYGRCAALNCEEGFCKQCFSYILLVVVVDGCVAEWRRRSKSQSFDFRPIIIIIIEDLKDAVVEAVRIQLSFYYFYSTISRTQSLSHLLHRVSNLLEWGSPPLAAFAVVVLVSISAWATPLTDWLTTTVPKCSKFAIDWLLCAFKLVLCGWKRIVIQLWTSGSMYLISGAIHSLVRDFNLHVQ